MAGVAGLPHIIYVNECDKIPGPKSPSETPVAQRDCRTSLGETRRLRREAKALEIVKAIRRPEQTVVRKLRHTELQGDNPNPTGFVYFVYAGGRIKIGYATDVAARMYGIATHCPLPATLLLTITGSLEDEEFLHEMFEDDQANLEWFTLSDDLRHFLESKLECDGAALLFDAEFGCKDFFIENAARAIELFEDPLFDSPPVSPSRTVRVRA